MDFPKLPNQWKEDGYEIDRFLGRGSYGEVYRIIRNKGTKLEEVSALKILTHTLSKQDLRRIYDNDFVKAQIEETKKFDQEIREASLLEQFIDIEEIVQFQGSCIERMPTKGIWKAYIQMEYLDNVVDYVKENKTEFHSKNVYQHEILTLGIDICSALEACHKRGILHRDIKPENILVRKKIIEEHHGYRHYSTSYRLGDFGCSKEMMDGSMTTVGTFNYMAPELIKEAHYDQRSDLYSLGLVLYYLANACKPAFSEYDAFEAYNLRVYEQKELSTPLYVYPPLQQVILKACSYLPENRYQSAREMKEALIEVMEHPYGFCPECGSKLELVFDEEEGDLFVTCKNHKDGYRYDSINKR